MADNHKMTTELPPYSVEVTNGEVSSKRRSYIRYAIVAVSIILIVASVLTAILVGMHLFQQSEKEILKYTMDLNKDTKQEINSDPNSNIVQYHVKNTNYDLLVMNDFNRDIQTFKVQENTQTICYTAALNRTVSLSPSAISELSKVDNDEDDKNSSEYVIRYRVSGTPISDISFLSKTVTGACKGISTYWLYPYCDTDSSLKTKSDERSRRALCSFSYCCSFTWFLRCKKHCTIDCPI